MALSRQAAEAMIEQAAARIKHLDQLQEVFGDEPPERSVIRAIRDINGYEYTYAIIRAGNKWWASGPRSGKALNGLTWEELLEWLEPFDLIHYEVIQPPAELSAPRPRESASHQPQDLSPQGYRMPKRRTKRAFDDFDHEEGSYTE